MLDLMRTFDYDDQPVRVLLRDGEPWLVAADVCRVLEIANSRDAVARLDEDEKGVGIADTLGGAQEMGIVSESGFYALVFTSRKSEARAFRKWVTGTVLPALRKTGAYTDPLHLGAAPERPPLDFMARQDVSNWLSMVREARLLRGPAAAVRMWNQSPLPALEGDQPLEPEPDLSIDGLVASFLAARCTVTGDPHDRVASSEMIAACNAWIVAAGDLPFSRNMIALALARVSERYRCPETGRRMRRSKRSTTIYQGVVLSEASSE